MGSSLLSWPVLLTDVYIFVKEKRGGGGGCGKEIKTSQSLNGPNYVTHVFLYIYDHHLLAHSLASGKDSPCSFLHLQETIPQKQL